MRTHATRWFARAARRARPILLCAAVTLACPCAGPAQDSGPVFLLQPGFLSADIVSAPAEVNSTSGFNFRFATRFATSARWLSPFIGASVTPYGTSGQSTRNTNAPALFAGNAFPLISADRTDGWLTVELPILLYHTFGGGGERNPDIYGRDLHAQLAVLLHVGRKTLRDLGQGWLRLDAYLFVEQNLTPNEDATSGRTDRFNPVFLYGVSIPFGGSARP